MLPIAAYKYVNNGALGLLLPFFLCQCNLASQFIVDRNKNCDDI